MDAIPDLCVDTPATVAIIGAGAIGMEAALYARYLGYDVIVLDRDNVGAELIRRGFMTVPNGFLANCSPLGIAALRAQLQAYEPPTEHKTATYDRWLEEYLLPLSDTDLVRNCIWPDARVVAIGRTALEAELTTTDDEITAAGQRRFRLLCVAEGGIEKMVEAKIVIDASGTGGAPFGAGRFGAPVPGESALAQRLEYAMPDILGTQSDQFRGRRTLVVGDTLEAAHLICGLAELCQRQPSTRVVWRPEPGRPEFAVAAFPAGPAERLKNAHPICKRARDLCRGPDIEGLTFADSNVAQFGENALGQQIDVTLNDGTIEAFDRVVISMGHRPDHTIHRDLCVAIDPVTLAPDHLAEPLCVGQVDATCDTAQWRQWLPTTEPHFYFLGAKTFGCMPGYETALGLTQIRALFQIIGGRKTLDLYATAGS